ncbi:MAG: tRNA pseudouridine(55) synthase [Candidatus Cryptobacteroides sp.]|nr:tRNA pseudouridine(55) synthase [Candidatus Cryptobacteroides sp.]
MSFSRDIADYPEGIVLAVDKPYRWTSADVIRKLKYAAIKHFGKKNLKVGHAGTLDPLATGVLLVCIGNACKRAQELQDHDKEYIARIRFGATTPSYDLEKEVDRRFPYEHITADAVRAALPAFLGEQEQVAPLFSAKSVDGVRAYELARKLYRAGKTEAIDAAALETLHRNRITISELELLDFTEDGIGVSEPSLRDPSHSQRASHGSGPLPLTRPRVAMGSDTPMPSSNNSASSRIHVADTSALGLPEATIRIACSKGTYIRAFARDLGETLGSGAHLSGLIRSRSGDYTIDQALSVEEALTLLQAE